MRGFVVSMISGIVLTCLLARPAGMSSNDGSYHPSIHQLDLERYADVPAGEHHEVAPVRRNRYVTHVVYGWYPYWMLNAYLNLDWSLLSHISFFSLEAASDGSITAYHNWPSGWTGLVSTAQAAGVKVTLTCTLFDGPAINTLIASPTYRNNLIGNLVAACQAGGAEGVNIDFEGSGLNAGNLVTFMAELRAGFDAAIPGAHISMATPAVDWSGSFDYDQLALSCDHLIAMCYDYHWKGGNPGPVSPLTAGSIWSQYCVDWTINDYITFGTPRNQFVMGVPYYGIDWEVTGSPTAVPAADGPGNGVARFYNAIQTDFAAVPREWDPHSQTPWFPYYTADPTPVAPHQVWYDDAVSLGAKYDTVLSENLGGIGIWALGYDEGYSEVWDEVDSHFGTSITPTPTPTPEPTPFTLIIDNLDPGCTITGTSWSTSEYGNCYGVNKHYSNSGTGAGAATYAADFPAGEYQVTAWVNDGAYTSAAEYAIHHAGGTDVLTVSQNNTMGGWWLDLGTYVFGGAGSVVVSDNRPGTEIVVADAIRWVCVSAATPTPVPEPLPAVSTGGVVLLLVIIGLLGFGRRNSKSGHHIDLF